MTHVWRWRKWLPERHGEPCRVLARGRGKIKNVLIEFEDGHHVITSRWAIRKRKGDE